MPLYQNSVLNKYLKSQDEKVVKDAYDSFTSYFHSSERQENIRNSKEEQFQEGFLRELFVKILGYTLNPEPNYNLTTELKNEKGAKKTDGAIVKNDKALAVIELKGTDTKDLDKVNDQAFNYKNNHSECVYVVTSNFEKLRFFIHNAVEHIEFNLFKLSYEDFRILWLCLEANNLLENIPLKVKEESIVEEEKITKYLYRDYSSFKNDVWLNLCTLNPDKDQLLLFKKTQKLLDRFLFIFFAEDSGLLPPNSISRMVKRYDQLIELDAYKSLYDIFKQYFGYINKGRKGKTSEDDIFAYNGGLFIEDKLLDGLKLNDDILKKHVLTLTAYDFESEVDVNILGHIFENSLNEIENVKAKLDGKEIDKTTTKRKKDGVFYTPKYITKYIVDNTVGVLCKEKKKELKIVDEEYAKGRRNRKKEVVRKLDSSLQKYRKWLLEITICDPACGSGAFLNQALEFLIEEHTYIDELESQLMGMAMIFPGVENHILENNIFGVDINEESVEIAKLSLWLRTAQRGRKLTSLNKNVKCGNSLISDQEEVGTKAFDWRLEFDSVFSKGGFDVVIGNPPYVSHERVGNKKYLATNYKSHQGFADLFCYFYELGSEILKDQGVLSFITSNSFLKADYGTPLRSYLLENTTLLQIINVEDAQIFSDAIVNSSILTYSKGVKKDTKCLIVNKKYETRDDFWSYIESNKFYYSQTDFDNLPWNLVRPEILSLRNKIQGSNPTLEGLETKIRLGIATGSNEAFVIDEATRNKIITQDPKSRELIKPILRGKDIERYYYNLPKLWVLLTKNGVDVESEYPAIFEHLDSFGDKFKRRGAKGKHWTNLRACSFFEDFKKEKIVWIELSDNGRFALCKDEIYLLNSAYFLLPPEKLLTRYLLAVLNSSILKFYLKQIANTSGVGTTRWINIYVKQFPIPVIKRSQQELIGAKSLELENCFKNLQKVSQGFVDFITEKYFGDNSIPRKLKNWHQIEFKDLLKQIKKISVEINHDAEEEMMLFELFKSRKKQYQEEFHLSQVIDSELDRLISEAYGLDSKDYNLIKLELNG